MLEHILDGEEDDEEQLEALSNAGASYCKPVQIPLYILVRATTPSFRVQAVVHL